MKTTLCTTLLCTLMVGTCFAETTAEQTPAQVTLMQAFSQAPKSVSVEAISALAGQSETPNMWGTRFMWSIYNPSSANSKLTHEYNLSLGLLWGNEDSPTNRIELFELPIAVGYNANYRIDSQWTVFAGAKAGLTYANFRGNIYNGQNSYSESERAGALDLTFATGVKYDLNDSIYLSLSYEFLFRADTYYDHFEDYNTETSISDVRTRHIISLGAAMKF